MYQTFDLYYINRMREDATQIDLPSPEFGSEDPVEFARASGLDTTRDLAELAGTFPNNVHFTFFYYNHGSFPNTSEERLSTFIRHYSLCQSIARVCPHPDVVLR